MSTYRITLQFEATDDQEALAVGSSQAASLAASRLVTAEIQRAYYWEPIWVDDEAAKDPAAPAQIAAS